MKTRHLLLFLFSTLFFSASRIKAQCTCITCTGTVIVDQNVTVNFNGGVPVYSGDPDLAPFFSFDISGATPDTWKAIFDLHGNKLLVTNGATITVTNVPATGNNQVSPGILIRSDCEVEVQPGGKIIVNSKNQKAGDLVIETNGHITINGEVRNEVSGTNGLPGALTLYSKCGNINIGGSAVVQVLGVDMGGNLLTLYTCGGSCNNGDIIINGLVKSFAHAHGGDQSLNRPNIKVVSIMGAVTINANSAEPMFDEYSQSGTLYDIWGGLLSWTRDNAIPGKVEVQANNDIVVNGHGTDPTGPVRNSFGAIAAIATASSAPGGLIDVRSLNGNIIANDRAFDVSGRNRLAAGNFAMIRLAARFNISLNRLGANNNYNPVLDASSPSVGDKGGSNEIRSYAGSISIGNNAMISASVPAGSGSIQGSNSITSCTGLINNGSITPADANTADDNGVCSPGGPSILYTSICPTNGDPGPEKRGSVDRERPLPERTVLMQSYPNPFNRSTSIGYTLSQAEHVTLKVYSITGKEMATLTESNQAAGEYHVQWVAGAAPDGIYIVRLQAGKYSGVSKLVFVK